MGCWEEEAGTGQQCEAEHFKCNRYSKTCSSGCEPFDCGWLAIRRYSIKEDCCSQIQISRHGACGFVSVYLILFSGTIGNWCVPCRTHCSCRIKLAIVFLFFL